MTVFKYFLKLMRTRVFSALLYLGITMGMVLLFTQTGPATEGDFAASTARITIFDEDNTTLSGGLTDFLAYRHQLVILENDAYVLEDALFFLETQYILTIPAGFEAQFLTNPYEANLENMQADNSTIGFAIDQDIDGLLITLATYLNSGLALEDALNYAIVDQNRGVAVSFLAAQENTNVMMYFRFFGYGLISIISAGIAPVFFEFKKKDIARRIDCSATSFVKRNWQMALGCVVGALALWAVTLIIYVQLFGNYAANLNNLLRVGNSFAFLILSISVAFLLGNTMPNQTALSGSVSMVGMAMAFLSGTFIPLEFFGDNVSTWARFVPMYWYNHVNDSLQGIYSFGGSIARTFWQGTGIQLAFALAIFGITLLIIRQKKMQAVY